MKITFGKKLAGVFFTHEKSIVVITSVSSLVTIILGIIFLINSVDVPAADISIEPHCFKANECIIAANRIMEEQIFNDVTDLLNERPYKIAENYCRVALLKEPENINAKLCLANALKGPQNCDSQTLRIYDEILAKKS